MRHSNIRSLMLLTAALAFIPLSARAAGTANDGQSFGIGENTFLLNGKPFVVKAAEIHYPRIPQPYWEHRIKMCKALGMNTICIYIFWNIHEQKEGVFDFKGQNDVALFCRLAQKNGMYVIVRPGPYVCAEWEMGGLPWWLLKKKDIRLRELDPYFMERVKIFEKKVAEQLAPLTIERGGPIIMMQVENEYGSYGTDKPYISAIRDCLSGLYGNGLTLFQCDWSSNFEKNGLDDLLWTMNFGTGANIDQQFQRLMELRPNTPKMCSEYWSGWFDKWGAHHETRPAKEMVAGIDEMLSKGISFSLYMTHGGTSFGHWAGANSPGFQPDVTSYDYDAPINEYGLATDKYRELRGVMEKYAGGKKLPAVPKALMPLISVPRFKLSEYKGLTAGIDTIISSYSPMTFEDLDMGWGSVIYTTVLPEIPSGATLTITDCHDYATLFVDNRFIGSIDRVKNEKTITLPALSKGQRLAINIEAMGRINFGRAIKDFKGITDRVTINADVDGHQVTWELKNWKQAAIPDSYENAVKALGSDKPADAQMNKAGYYRGFFTLKRVGDTFLNMEAFGKGQVYVNGHPLGRFWNIGPQQALYLPGCWLKKGKNEVVVLDVVGPKGDATAYCQDHPELDKLNIEKNRKHNNIEDRPDLNNTAPVATGAFGAGGGWQTVKLTRTAKGRYLAIECLSTYNRDEPVAIAELYVRDNTGKRLSREPWTVKYADSENSAQNRTGDKVYDLQESTYWQTETPVTSEKGEAFESHLLVIDLGTERSVTAIDYLPRSEEGTPGGVKDYRIYVY